MHPPIQTGVFWGAFDPLTRAHGAIIRQALEDIPLQRLLIVVNGGPGKAYDYLLEQRVQMVERMCAHHGLAGQVTVLAQDTNRSRDYHQLRAELAAPLCAIAGADSYGRWCQQTSPQARALYDRIAVVPRGEELCPLLDANAFLLPISNTLAHVSSTAVKASLQLEDVDPVVWPMLHSHHRRGQL